MTTYIAKQGETWDSIAYRIYSSEKAMTVLIDANKQLANKRVFSGGEVLQVPADAKATTIITPPWVKNA